MDFLTKNTFKVVGKLVSQNLKVGQRKDGKGGFISGDAVVVANLDGRDNEFDSEEFIIELTTDNENIIYKGKGNYRENYDDFKSLLGELV